MAKHKKVKDFAHTVKKRFFKVKVNKTKLLEYILQENTILSFLLKN